MKNILVTGGAGYIGSHAAKALARAGYRPVTYDNLVYGNHWAVQWGPFVEGDIGDRALLLETFKRYRIEAVMHFAAFAYVGESMTKPEMYFENNVAKSLILLDAMRIAGIKHMVFSSTCATYGTPDEMPITEDTPQQPVNPYGETKLMIERALHWHGKAHGLSSVALRYFNAAGADPEGDIGESHLPETHLIPLILDAALGRRAAIDIYGTDYPTPDGSCQRDYIHVADLADAHVRALEYLLAGGATAAVNLGTGRAYSVREVIAAVERVTGKRVPRREMPRRAGDPAVLVADPTRAANLLGWRPVRSDLDTIIRTAWTWHLRTPEAALAVGD
ncbi:MAG: UDP-arabinose 4-epimerase [Aliidongia sp.]|jgi:UDP-arabinose 4-epimerase|nr:UDP-arabinose 4-epimerase [Aliidongia sp.]